MNCQVTKEFKSPKKNGGSVVYKDFKVGSTVSGNVIEGTKMFKTMDGFVIPKSHLKPFETNKKSNANGEVDYAEIVEEKPTSFSLPKDFKANMPSVLKVKSKNAINGALIGLVSGLIFSMAKQKSKLLFSVIGAVGGFVLGNVYNTYINEDQNDSKDTI